MCIMKIFFGDIMRAKIKFLIALLLLGIGAAILATQFSLKGEMEKRIVSQLAAQGFSKVEVSIAEIDQQHVVFSHIGFAKDKIEVAVEGLNIAATNLPYRELLQSNYANVRAEWAVKSLSVTGIPYALPPLTGTGNYYMKDKKPVVTGELHDEQLTHRAELTVTSTVALLENIRVQWQEALLSAEEVVIALNEKKPIYIPLQMKNLPLSTLLSLVSSDKATGSGVVSGKVDIVVKPDGSFLFDDGKFAAGNTGLIQLSPGMLPGEGAQMDIARTALANFHYKDLSLVLDQDAQRKALIRLNLEGNNPDALNGRAIKLQVNFTGDVLELLQQTILPMANPADLIEKETP